MSDPKFIYLGPACQKDGDGREWCEDDVWPQCECGCSSVRYVLEADAKSERDAAEQRNMALTDALQNLSTLVGRPLNGPQATQDELLGVIWSATKPTESGSSE